MASKRRLHRRQCSNKVRHETKEAAFKAIHFAQPDHLVHVYKCPWCHGFHIGAPPQATLRHQERFNEL